MPRIESGHSGPMDPEAPHRGQRNRRPGHAFVEVYSQLRLSTRSGQHALVEMAKVPACESLTSIET